ncbi:MAG: phenylphosphate carboxylase subunit delta [Gammaproteobacteria bacterium]|nr:MAG: phenylphosphate carboxylase subunit delta [Gammaproteobacteria bacterium]
MSCSTHSPPATRLAAQIRLLVLDVDGVLTDGRLIYGADGSEAKAFNVRDGLGIKLAMRAGIEVAVISGRGGPAVDRRMAELGIRHVYLEQADKPAALASITADIGAGLDVVACVGDDLPDLVMMERCALGIAVADAHQTVRDAADWVTGHPGGHGAVREVCDLLIAARGN